jgi:hypothetical protein
MALLFVDGFDIDFPDNDKGIWDDVITNRTGQVFYQDTVVRGSDGAAQFNSTDGDDYAYLSKTFSPTFTEFVAGLHFYMSGSLDMDNGRVGIIGWLSSGAWEGSVSLQRNNSCLQLVLGNPDHTGTVIDSVVAPEKDRWHHLSVHIVMDAATGSYDVRLNGKRIFYATNVDTVDTAADLDRIRVGILSANSNFTGMIGSMYIDNFVLYSGGGSLVSDHVGDFTVSRLDPDGEGYYTDVGGGSLTAWENKTGADYYADIDDVASFGDLPSSLNLVWDDPVGSLNRVSVTMDDVGAVSLWGTQIAGWIAGGEAGDTLAPNVRISGTDYEGDDVTPGVAFAWDTHGWEVSPASSAAWTAAEVNAAEMGYTTV